MKIKMFILFLIAVAVFAAPVKSFAKDDLNEKVENLQKQIDDLKAQQENETKATAVSSKFPVELYGFVDAQLILGTARTQMYGGLNSVAVQSRVIDKTTAGGGRHTWFGATPQNSRVGLNWKGTKVSKELSIGGLFEIDFVNVINQTSYGTSPIPRIRHLYLDLFSDDNWSLLAGQTWDLFSPFNTASLSLGGNLWFQGNLGFRRPQVRFTYKIPFDNRNNLKIAASINHPSNTDDLMNSGISSGIPLGEGLVQYNRKMKYGDFIIAVSGTFGANTIGNKYVKMAGGCFSLAVPVHKFLKLAGEVQYGQDLGIFLSYANSTGNSYGNRGLSAWGQITSQWHEKFDTAVGYAIDNLKSTKVAAGNVTRNQIAFANFRFFPVKPFYVGIEYEYLRTAYKGNGSSPANVVFSNLVYNF